MATKKTTKKAENKDMLYIDANKLKGERGTRSAIAMAKIEQGKPIDKDDFQTLVNEISATTINVLFQDCNAVIRLNDGRIIRTTLVPENADEEKKDEGDQPEPKKPGFFDKLKAKFKK